MKTRSIASLAAAAAVALPITLSAQDETPEPQPDFRPDGIICKPVRTDEGVQLRCAGDDVYNRTGKGQGVRGETTLRGSANYGYRLQNDGGETDAFLIRGTRGNKFFRVGYFQDGKNVTGQVSGRGLRSGPIEAGEAIENPIRIIVKANPRAVLRAGKRAKKRILTAVTAVSRGSLAASEDSGTQAKMRPRPNRNDRKPGDRRPNASSDAPRSAVVDRVLAGTRLVRRASDRGEGDA